jgi:hypothetical protein
MSRFHFAFALILAAPLAIAACGGNGGNTSTGTNTFPGGAGGTGNSGAGGMATSSTSSTSGNLFDAGPGTGGTSTTGTGGAGGSYLIYASTDTDLYTLDPNDPSLTLQHVGTFDCIDPVNGPHKSMVDIAIDKTDSLWGVTGHDVYPLTVQGTTVHCGQQIALNNPQPGMTVPTFYALTFAPVGVLDPAKEVLVAGNSAGELWAIDAQGQVSQHGIFGTVPPDDGHGHAYANAGQLWELSGDIVFLANQGNPVGFATVRDCPTPPSTTGCNKIDTLIEIDMAKLGQPGKQIVTKAVRGQVVKNANCSDTFNNGYGSMYGIAAWNDLVYGFSRTGNLVQISNVDGSACLVHTYSGDNFSGAAVTTLAPVKPPPPVN